jgi:hypothetical protein
VLGEQVVSMALAGAVLGPLLDHQHSRFDVLHYAHPLLLRLPDAVRAAADVALPPPMRGFGEALAWREAGGLETAAFVPPLFGFAAVVIGLGHTLGDDYMAARAARAAAEAGAGEGDAAAAEMRAAPRTGYEPGWRTVTLAVSAFALQYYASGAPRFSPAPSPPRS